MTVWKSIKCNEKSVISGIQLNATLAGEATCNGYHSWETPFTYTAIVNGKPENLTIGKLLVYYSYLNGNMVEVNTGTITEGRCKGDVFFSANSYIADDQFGCSGKGMSSVTMKWISAQVTGKNCLSNCQLDNGYIKLNPAIHD
ncbi:uncharacterized protein LOC128953683 [Oppia nitens]|uniref:uncharacterized protein LOC128953683 n=1 Tax=Oppia nitens TaxID=1686743 RepID=UPI0023DBAF7D|nr:uncharacterized protein LOC128953683 [Oppia nitens]